MWREIFFLVRFATKLHKTVHKLKNITKFHASLPRVKSARVHSAKVLIAFIQLPVQDLCLCWDNKFRT